MEFPLKFLKHKYQPVAVLRCAASGLEGFSCTRREGHLGSHVACGQKDVYEIWGAGKPYWLHDWKGGKK